MSKIFDTLREARKQKSDGEFSKTSWKAKVGPPQAAIGSLFQSSSAEEYDRLRQRLTDFLPRNTSKVVMFVSPSGMEENASVAVNFGYSVAWMGESVILIDADRKCSSLQASLGTNQVPGVMELISGEATTPEVLQETSMSKLFFIPGGTKALGPLSDAEGNALTNALEALKAHGDWIVFVASPGTAGNDFVAISRIVQGVMLVISSEKTRWESAMKAKEQLQEAGANILGAILVRRRTIIPAWLERWL